MLSKLTSRAAGATIVLVFFSLVSKGVGFIREVLIANFFGANEEYEVYLVGAILPVTINTIVYFIAQNYFIPEYNKIKSRSNGEESFMTSGIFWLFVLAAFIISLVLYLVSEPVISFYTGTLTGDPKIHSLRVFQILLITIPLNAGFSIAASYLIGEYRYAYPAVSQLLSGVLQILFIIGFYEPLGVYSIPLGLLAGYAVQLLYIILYSRKKIDYRFKLENLKFFKNTEFGAVIAFIIIIEAINQLYVIFDRYYFDVVEEGGIAALNYATFIYLLPLAIISVALATVVFPKFSETLNSKNFIDLKKYYYKSLLYNVILYIPIVIILFFFGDFIIKIVFERGKFSGYNTLQTFGVLQVYTLSILFYSSYAIINKMIFSMQMIKQLLWISMFCLILKIILNAVLVDSYQQYGLALASSFSYIFLSVSGFFLVQYKFRTYEIK